MSDINARIESFDGCMSTMNGSNKMFTPMPGGRIRKSIKAKSFKQSLQTTLGSSPVLCSGQRKTLQVIQPAVCKKKLVDTTNKPKTSKRKHNSDVNDKPSKVSRNDKKILHFPIYEDPKSSSESGTEIEKGKTAEEETMEMMVEEPHPQSYWKEVAEERRVALEDTLEENQQLHETIVELRTENGRLKEMADQAEYLANVLQNVIDGKEMDADEESEESNKDDECNLLSEKPDEEERDEHSDSQPPNGSLDNTGASDSSECKDTKECSVVTNGEDTL